MEVLDSRERFWRLGFLKEVGKENDLVSRRDISNLSRRLNYLKYF